jgi:cytochrome c oxidase assembly protein Cox11
LAHELLISRLQNSRFREKMLIRKARHSLFVASRVLSGLVALFAVQPVWSAQPQVLRGHVPAVVSQLTPIGRLPAEQRLKLAIGLPLRDPGGLDQLLQQLYQPGSPIFHQWLTPAELTERFSATEQDVRTVSDWAKAHGLNVTLQHPNRVVLDVEGTVANIEAALHVMLRVYNHPTEARTFFAPDTDPSIDAPATVEAISGLDDFALPHPLHRIKPLDSSGPISPRSGSGPSGTYRGGDFRAAYVPGTSLDGTGQTVGLLQFDGYYTGDITAYETQAGLPNVPLTNVAIDGGVSTPGSGNSEVCLDIEMVIAMAPGVSRIYVYEAPNPSPWVDLLSRMQTDNLSKQLSCSWGGGTTNPSAETIFKMMAGQGQSFYNATGDSDAFTGAIPFPSDSTNITQVGGTTLTTTGPGGSYVSEKVWNWGLVQGSYVGSSGGISTFYPIPSYQAPVNMSKNQGSTTMRNVPDVALVGDNIYVTYNNGSAGSFGGTSCAAPLWAGFTALINQQAAANGSNPIGFMNPPVYNIGLGANYLTDFHDITVGDNTWSGSPTKFYATNGYDLCTGWGTPNGMNLINALTGPPVPLLASNSLALTVESCSNGVLDPGETATFSFGLKNIGSAPPTNLVATLQSSGGVTSPSAAQTYGALAAGSAASRSFTFTAAGSCGGSVTATLQLQDGPANLGTVQYVIPLGIPTPAAPLVENFDGASLPGLPAGWSSVLVSGAQTNWATSSVSSYSSPNSAFIVDSPNSGENALVSPVFFIGSATAQLTFHHNYNLEFLVPHHGATTYYDGGVLEIKIGGGAFTDIITAGGSFVTGGYNATLTTGNPLAGRQAWSGNSSGWVATTVNLPAAAAGQNVQLRWACAVDSDNVNGGVGWYVDSISLSDTVIVCCSSGALPSFSTQPVNQAVVAGSNATFTVSASGSPAYQWYFNGTNLLNGKTAGTLTLTNVQPSQAGGYSATASNVSGVVTSSVAQLTVQVPPAITTQPTNQTVISGGNVSFIVADTGTPAPACQWQFSGTNLTGATSTTLQLDNVQSSQAGNYRAVLTNVAGSVTSSVAQLTVDAPPSITTQPTNQTIISGSNVSFVVGATGIPTPACQWQFSGTNLSGATSTILQLNNVQPSQAGNYRAVLTNAAGSVTSSVAQLTIDTPPSITTQPTNQTVLAATNVSFTVTATGIPTPACQWQFSGTNLAGATSTTLQLNNVQPSQAGNYRAVLTNVAGSVTSSVAQLTVDVPPSITTQPTNQTVISGSNVSFIVTATGIPTPACQWQFSGTNLSGATSTTLQLNNVQPSQAGNYRAVLTNAAGSVTSGVAQLTVDVPPSITAQPTNQTVITGSNVSFIVTATGIPTPACQWQFSGTNLPGATLTALQLNNVQPSQAGAYLAILTNAAGSITSAVAQLTVDVPPSITSQPTNRTVIAGSNVSFIVIASGIPTPSCQWQFSGTNLPGATSTALQLNNVQPSQAGAYLAILTNVAGSVTSSVANLTVLVPPSITGQPTNVTVVTGNNVTFQIRATGSAPLGYTWTFNGATVAGGNSNSLVLLNVQLSQAGAYAAVVSNAAGSVTSSAAILRILDSPTLAGISRSGNLVSVWFPSIAGLNYTLESKDSLDAPNWTSILPSVQGNGSTLFLQDTNAILPSRFYRARCE